MAKKPQVEKIKTWRPTNEDAKIMKELRDKLGVNDPAIIRMGLRKLAAAEGIGQ